MFLFFFCCCFFLLFLFRAVLFLISTFKRIRFSYLDEASISIFCDDMVLNDKNNLTIACLRTMKY